MKICEPTEGSENTLSNQQSQSVRELASPEFVMQVGPNGNVCQITPVLKGIRARTETIGAIADENAVFQERRDVLFDPRVSGGCAIFDFHLTRSFSTDDFGKATDWKATQAWTWDADHWVWTLGIDLDGAPDRELKVELRVPHPIFPGSPGSGHSRWHLWMPMDDAPYGNDYGIKQVHVTYCIDEATDVLFPLCTLYNPVPDANIGFSYLLPPEQRHYLDFEFRQRMWMTKMTWHHVALTGKKGLKLEMWCFSHAGDWRPALGFVRKKFPRLLGPVEGQEKVDGNMAYTIPMIPEKRIADWAGKMKLKWNELLLFRHFGDFAPEEPFDATHFQTKEHPEWGIAGLRYNDIRRYIETCHRHGVMVMPYFNLSECESELARKRFPECIARIFNGEELVTWNYYDRKHHTLLMNADPAYPYFHFLMEQYQKLLKKLPEIDGFFFDQMSYGWIDTAHFDGETFFNNRPAYNLANMYLRALREARRIFPRPRINGIGNGVVRWQLMEFLDGVMVEGAPEFLGRASFFCPERPTMCLAEGEQAFQTALYYGSWLHVSPYYRYPTNEPLPKDAVRLFAMYNPMFEFIAGRKWVYDPAPILAEVRPKNIYRGPLLRPGAQVKANIFKTPFNGYAAVVMAIPWGGMVKERFSKDVHVRIRVAGIEKLKTAIVFGTDYRGYYSLKPKPVAHGYYEIHLPKHGAATMIVLVESLAASKKEGKWSKLREGLH
ncbi:MAG: hypothetical protein HY360_04020 [Verrucomicrobia bacterium]|nr:hypothetical protein [Verrucomicrobiota bacterium]